MDKTLAEQIGDLVPLSLSCPSMGMGGGSHVEEQAQDRWAARVHAEAERLRTIALAHDPKALRVIDLVRGMTR